MSSLLLKALLSMRARAGYDGIIAVHKPANWTSFDVVAKVRGSVGKHIREQNPGVPHKQCRVKVGHGGTLDPAATGVLVIGIGKGTKAMDLYTKGSKSYRAVGLLGHETDTGDAEGVKVGEEMDHSHVTQEMLEGVLQKFVGDIMQVPPQYSAIKKDGKKVRLQTLRFHPLIFDWALYQGY
jgi:tRNA pseudouridine55 synthase